MARPDFDRSSKWLLEHQGKGILFLGGLRDVLSTRALQPEVVQPARLPDGLLEVHLRGQKQPRLVLVEVATYPEKRVVSQATSAMTLVLQARGVLPDVMVLVLCPRGRYRVPSEDVVRSALGWCEAGFKWKVVELWLLPAEDLLAAADVGLMPWVSLAQFEGPPEPLLQRCRERIDREGGRERANLLAVSQVLARLKFDRPEFLAIFGGRQAMIDSPLLREFEAEIRQQTQQQTRQEYILGALKVRFGKVPEGLEVEVRQRVNEEQLNELHDFAVVCPSVEAFQERLRGEPPRAAGEAKGKRRRKKS
jgi:hypothetical protein